MPNETNVRWILVDENDNPVDPEKHIDAAIEDLKHLLPSLEDEKAFRESFID